jgi:hypothetical protein
MNDFIVSVLSSIVAGIILIVITAFISRSFRDVLFITLNKLIGSDIAGFYRDSDELQEELSEDLKHTRHVYFFAGRGGELSRRTFDSLFNRPKEKMVKIRVLLPQTNPPETEYNWTKQRCSEMNKFEPGSGDSLPSQIESNINFIKFKVPHQDINIRLYNVPHTSRIIITDKFAYFTPYLSDQHGKNTPIYKFYKGGNMYKHLKRFINQVWDASLEPIKD